MAPLILAYWPARARFFSSLFVSRPLKPQKATVSCGERNTNPQVNLGESKEMQHRSLVAHFTCAQMFVCGGRNLARSGLVSGLWFHHKTVGSGTPHIPCCHLSQALTIVGFTRELQWCWWSVPRGWGGPRGGALPRVTSEPGVLSLRCTTPPFGQGCYAVILGV